MLPQPARTHLPSVAQLILSVIGLVTSLFGVLFLWMAGRLGASMQSMDALTVQQFNALIWIGLFISLLAIPSLVFSIRRLAGKPSIAVPSRWVMVTATFWLVMVIAGAYLIYQNPAILNHSMLKALITTLMVAIPLWWFVEFGRHKVTANSLQRQWGLLNFSIFAGLPITILIEMLFLLLVCIFGAAWLMQQPEFKALWMTVQTQLMLNPEDFSNVFQKMGPLVQKPGVIVTGFLLVAVLIPLIEETLKPLALWFFIKKEWQPSEGFTAGLICGASFALVESILSMLSIPQETWVFTLVGRIGTGLLHTLTAGLTGWALVSTWRDGKYLRVGLVYLASASIHGLWNFFALLYGLGTNTDLFGEPAFSGLIQIAPTVLGGLFVLMLNLLFLMNRKIRFTQVPPPIPAPPALEIG